MFILHLLLFSGAILLAIAFLFYFFKGANWLVNDSKFGKSLDKPRSPYNYKSEELWEQPNYWKF